MEQQERDAFADLVVLNGTVLTLDDAGRRAGGVAVRNGRIIAVDSAAAIRGMAGPSTAVLDLDGRTVVPGFIESHNHPAGLGIALAASVDAGTPPNERVADIVGRVESSVRDHLRGEWITGYRYDDSLLRDDRHPTRADLDPVSPANPVVLRHVTGHFAVANSAALRAVGITGATPDPPGGRIERDRSGKPTGVLAEQAAFLVNSKIPVKGLETVTEALRQADAEYLRQGVTTVHDTGVGMLGGVSALVAYRKLVAAGALHTRVCGYLFHNLVDGLAEGTPVGPEPAQADARFRLGGVKIIADGSLQLLTGCLAEGYACAPEEHGMMLLAPEELSCRIAALDAAGWQVAVHGNGDAAIDAIIDAYARLDGGTGRRHRIEHCQTVREDQLDRMAEHDVLASFFVKHVYYWGDRHRDRFLGPERAGRISPLSSARARGIRFGLHADTPVTPMSPVEGIWCAVARRTRSGEPLGPEQAITAEQALRGYTIDAAYLAGEDTDKGSIEHGKLADLTVLSGDPTACSLEELRALSVHATVVGGELEYVRNLRDER